MIDIATPNSVVEPGKSANSRSAKVFSDLVNYLNEERIDYVVLDPQGVKKEEEMIEFVVVPHVLDQLPRYILEFCKKYEFIPIQRIWYKHSSWLYVLSRYCVFKSKFEHFRLLFSSSYIVQGHYYFSADEILRNKTFVCDGNYWKLTCAYAFCTVFINCIEKGRIDKEQFTRLLEQWHCSKSSITYLLGRFFSKGKTNLISSWFAEEDFDCLATNLEAFKKDLRSPFFGQLSYGFIKWINAVKTFIRPAGLVVGLLGRDGSGKSTFINEMTKAFGDCFTSISVFKKHPRIFYKAPILNKNIGYHFSKPHLYKERGSLASFFKLNLLLLDFFFGYWFKVFPYKKNSGLVFYDRYFIDVQADPLRYRIKGNKFYIKLIHRLLPKPDLWIILDLSSDILLKRKQELTFEMSEQLRREYLKLQHKLANSIVLNNGAELKTTVDNATSFLISFMQQQFQKLS